MDDGVYPKQIERMLNVMTLVPPYGWGLLLVEVEKSIGTDALQRVIARVYHETERRKFEDLKRALAVIKREESNAQEHEQKTKKSAAAAINAPKIHR
jgi:hypothetical protein